MSRRRITAFVDEHGVRRELRDPDGAPSWRQLVALHRAGALTLVEPGHGEAFTKAEAAFAVDRAVGRGLLERRRPTDPAERFDRVCREILLHVRAHPACTTSSVVRAVRGGSGYVDARVRDLLELDVLEDRAARPGRGRARELWAAGPGLVAELEAVEAEEAWLRGDPWEGEWSRVDWLIEGLLPAGAIATVADLDDPPPGELLEGGVDVVLLLHDSGDEAFGAGGPILLSVHWRAGLVPGREPPPPFWIRFEPTRSGFVRVDEPKEAA